MIRRLIFAFGAVAISAMASAPLRAEEPAVPPSTTAVSPVEEPTTSPAAEPSPANASAPLSKEAPRPPSAMGASSQDTEDGTADELATEQAPATAESERTAERPAEAPAPASEEAADAEPSPTVEPAAKPSMALQSPEPSAPSKPASEPSPRALNVPATESAEAEALRKALSGLSAGASDEEQNERAALMSFYESRVFAPLWTAPQTGFTPAASAVAAEIKRSKDWGLDPRDFALPAGLGAQGAAPKTPEEMAAAEIKLSFAILKYGRYARGGRIINPSEQLSTYLDRRPQLLKPQAILDGIANSDQPDAYLHGLNPKHPQFERLRQKYLALAPRKQQSAEAKRLLANMEQWRWMPADLSDLYVWNNIPDFTQRVMKDDEVVRKEAIVTGQIGKQTPIFSRPLRKITFKPTWIVPDSIKVRELLPDLMQGGGLMRKWGLEVLRDGEPVNWRKIDWSATDIRNFEVIQPNGPKSVMGKVKFSFPSQHTVFMHDAAEGEKWMLRAPKRTYSHGCMRVQNPVGLAEILLREDKGWDVPKVREVLNTGGNNNEIPVERKIMIHMTYFTALVDDDGKLHTFPDVYGHERRITLALEGKWKQIEKGRDHLAPVELNEASAVRPRRYAEDEPYDPRVWRRDSQPSSNGSFLDSLFGGSRSGYGQYGQYPAPPRQYR